MFAARVLFIVKHTHREIIFEKYIMDIKSSLHPHEWESSKIHIKCFRIPTWIYIYNTQ